MNDAKIIKYIRKQIPFFKCNNCGKCCNDLIIFSDWEWNQIEDKRIATSLRCPYLNSENRCEIYEQRPIICRLYGVTKGTALKCKRECVPNRFLTKEKESKILSLYYLLLNKNIFHDLQKSADLIKIAEIIENSNKNQQDQYTNFLKRLSGRLKFGETSP